MGCSCQTFLDAHPHDSMKGCIKTVPIIKHFHTTPETVRISKALLHFEAFYPIVVCSCWKFYCLIPIVAR